MEPCSYLQCHYGVQWILKTFSPTTLFRSFSSLSISWYFSSFLLSSPCSFRCPYLLATHFFLSLSIEILSFLNLIFPSFFRFPLIFFIFFFRFRHFFLSLLLSSFHIPFSISFIHFSSFVFRHFLSSIPFISFCQPNSTYWNKTNWSTTNRLFRNKRYFLKYIF